MRWECPVFAIILAVLEVNAFLALLYFGFSGGSIEGCPTLLVFCRRLAWQLINNNWLRHEEQETAPEPHLSPIHKLVVAPPHARKWSGGTWICDNSQKYQQYFCSNKCKKRTRTYCVCGPGRWL